MNSNSLLYASALALWLTLATAAAAQSGGAYSIVRSAFIAGGTGSGGGYSIVSAIGQPAAQSSAGGAFQLTGGFHSWIDIEPPSSAASVVDATRAGGTISGTYVAGDNSAIGMVTLYVRPPAGVWAPAGPVSAGTWSYSPSAGDGAYRIATVASDMVENVQVAPSGSDPGDVTVLWNDTENSVYIHEAVGDGTFAFPMTDDIDVVIEFSGGASGGPIAVSRTVGDMSAPGIAAESLIDESLTITGTFSGSATLLWGFDPANAAGLPGPLDRVFQFESGILEGSYPVTPAGALLTVGPISRFGEWYAGNAPTASVRGWHLYGE